MAIQSYFFNAVKSGEMYDRTYTAEDFTKYLDGIVGSGVLPNPSNCLQVYASSGMQVGVYPGQAWLEGYKLINTANVLLTIETADVTLNRIDRVVMRVDKTAREIQITVKKGTAASSPQPPEVTQSEDVLEYGLATVAVNRNVTAITAADITDTRLDSEVCGVAQGLIQQVDTSTLYNQWQAAFDDWFASVQDTVVNNALIATYRNTVVVRDATTSIDIGISQYAKTLDVLEVYVNGWRLAGDEYTIDSAGKTVNFDYELSSGSRVEFVVLKTIRSDDATPAQEGVTQAIQAVDEIDQQVTSMRNNIAVPVTLFEGELTPTQTASMVYQSIPTLSEYDIVIVRAKHSNTCVEDKIFFMGTFADNYTQYLNAYLNNNYRGGSSIMVDKTNNRVGIRCEVTTGWDISSVDITAVFGIKLS